MQLSQEIKASIDSSVLCWLATASSDGIPNVSPKECFTYFGGDSVIIANIASPQTVRNIRQNKNACLSFINVFVQKGFQLSGQAEIMDETYSDFEEMKNVLNVMTQGKFPFKTITNFKVQKAKPIIAPSYILYPEKTEEERIKEAKKSYNI